MYNVSGRVKQDFYPRPPRGGRLLFEHDQQRREAISIHALREEGDVYNALLRLINIISIHALREEGDSCFWTSSTTSSKFLSTPSARRAIRRRGRGD